MKYLIILSLLALIYSCSNRVHKLEKKIRVEFYKDTCKIDYGEIKCIGKSKKEINVTFKGDTLIIPDSLKKLGSSVDIMFSFADTTIIFSNETIKHFYTDQNTIWEIVIDHRPYDYAKKLLNKSALEDSAFSTYIFWCFSPLEDGDGLCYTQKH